MLRHAAAPALAVAPVFQPNTNQLASRRPRNRHRHLRDDPERNKPAGQIFQRWEIDWGDGTPQTPDIQYSCDATADMTRSYAISTNVDAQRFNIDVSGAGQREQQHRLARHDNGQLSVLRRLRQAHALPAHAPG